MACPNMLIFAVGGMVAQPCPPPKLVKYLKAAIASRESCGETPDGDPFFASGQLSGFSLGIEKLPCKGSSLLPPGAFSPDEQRLALGVGDGDGMLLPAVASGTNRPANPAVV